MMSFSRQKSILIAANFVILLVLVLALTPFFMGTHLAHAASGTFQSYTYNGSAGSRPYYVYTPTNYSPGKAVPLIVMLHGCTQNPTDFATGTQMNQLADADQFIVVYPQQTSTYNSSSCWNWFLPADQSRGSGEPAIIAGIVQTVEQTTSQWKIDTSHVYVAGLSAGAAMAVIMGATYPDMFAASGVGSGLEYQAATSQSGGSTALSQGGPPPTQQGDAAYAAMGSFAQIVPTIVFHGTSDYVVYPLNGDQVVQQWIETNTKASHGTYAAAFNSPATTTQGQVSGSSGRAYETRTWNDKNRTEVQEYWTITGMGHAWSGGNSSGSYTDPNGPSESQAFYTFFMNHPRASGNPTPTPTTGTAPTATPTTAATATPVPTSTPPSGNNGVTATGSVALGASAYFTEEDVKVSNTAPVTALKLTITVQKTPGVAYNAMYNPGTAPFTMTHTDNGATIVFVYTLNAGQTLPVGTNQTFGAQITGTGTPHPTTGDTYSITATSGGVSNTLSGHF